MCVDRRSIAASSERDNDSAVLPLDYCLQNRASFREDNDSQNSSPCTQKKVVSLNKAHRTEGDRSTAGEKLNGYANKLAETQTFVDAVEYRPKQDISVHLDTSGTHRNSIRRNSMEEIKRMMDDTDGDDDGEHNGLHLDHGDKWPTSFWTQLCVLSHRTFKQSLPLILSKLNLIQVSMSDFCFKDSLGTNSSTSFSPVDDVMSPYLTILQ